MTLGWDSGDGLRIVLSSPDFQCKGLWAFAKQRAAGRLMGEEIHSTASLPMTS